MRIKQYAVGFVCGAILSASTAIFASDAIEAYLFPSKVLFHSGVTVTEIDGSEVLNYKEKAYVPLRSFAEATGSQVDFNEGNGSGENGNRPAINIYLPSLANNANESIEDPDHYVTVSELRLEKGEAGITRLTGGTVKINKELAGKVIDIEMIRKDGQILTSTDYVYLDNQDTAPPKPGDIRTFQTYTSFAGEPVSYRVAVRDFLKTEPRGIVSMYDHPFVILFNPPLGYPGTLTIGKVSPFKISFYNTNSKAVSLEPVNMQVEVYTRGENNEPLDLVYSFKLPEIGGKMNAMTGYTVTVPWNQRGNDRQIIPPGSYIAKLSRPDTVRYVEEGSTEVKSFTFLPDTRYPTRFPLKYEMRVPESGDMGALSHSE
ncbi:hypothetical protein [Paenibacillus hamazuiensis]|uniref:hypothetical protein n=1 Tax=Paenibacillus hamazuiensis TaxID=2936508 RepID=UPI002010A343|nr:hypothetical protein [Paenibacillus hamazuiensis]